MKVPRAILFDLDCTLTDRPATMKVFAQNLMAREDWLIPGHEKAEVLVVLEEADGNGYRPKEERAAHVLANLRWQPNPPEVDEFARYWTVEFARATQPMHGLIATLDALKEQGFTLGIITNGSPFQMDKIDVLGIAPYMATIQISGVAGVSKPDRRIFEFALDEIGMRPEEVWFVGDHPRNDVSGAQAVGMAGVWLAADDPWPEELQKPDMAMNRLSDIVTLLEKTKAGT